LKKYSVWHNWTDVTEVEMRAFFGVIINMGNIHSSNMESLWSQAFHSRIPFFGKVFRRKRFFQIFWALHLETITNPGQDMRTRTSRVSNYLDFLNTKFLENYIPEENLAVDESTVKFKGKISFIAYNPKKPTKWGLRIYVLSDSRTSYISTFVPYYGRYTTQGLTRPDLSFTSRIVLHLFKNLQQRIPDSKGYHIYTDRFYTNPILAKELLKQNCYLTGTIMTNKRGLPVNIKKPRLVIGSKIAYRKNNTLVLAWRDKRIVTMLSTMFTSSSQSVRRPRRSIQGTVPAQNNETMINKPTVIQNYIKNMGGVDNADQLATSYCFMRKTLKWWRKLFFWGFETSIVNSYILYKECETRENRKPLGHKKFRQKLLMQLIGNFRVPKSKSGRPSTGDTEQRLDGTGHFIYNNPNKHKDCTVCSNRKIPGGRHETTYFCDTCERKPGLHPGDCFKKYHTLLKFKV